MMTLPADLRAAARLEFSEVRRSKWVWFCFAAYVLLGGGFIFVGLRESLLLGFTGLGRVLMSLSHALVVLLPLLALTATTQSINRARDDGTLEFLFSQPIRRDAYFIAVSGVRWAVLVVPLALAFLLLAAVSAFFAHETPPWRLIGNAVAVSCAVMTAFTGIGMAITTLERSGARAVTWTLVLWFAGVALLDIALLSAMLRWRVDAHVVFALAVLNPVEAARLALLSLGDPDLAVLGPVGFYIANRVGLPALFALGTLWPAGLGVGIWWLTLRRFRRGDAV